MSPQLGIGVTAKRFVQKNERLISAVTALLGLYLGSSGEYNAAIAALLIALVVLGVGFYAMVSSGRAWRSLPVFITGCIAAVTTGFLGYYVYLSATGYTSRTQLVVAVQSTTAIEIPGNLQLIAQYGDAQQMLNFIEGDTSVLADLPTKIMSDVGVKFRVAPPHNESYYLPRADSVYRPTGKSKVDILVHRRFLDRIHGSVADQLTGKPIAHATVTIGEHTTVSDALGHWFIIEPDVMRQQTRFNLRIEHAEYLPYTRSELIVLSNDPIQVLLKPVS